MIFIARFWKKSMYDIFRALFGLCRLSKIWLVEFWWLLTSMTEEEGHHHVHFSEEVAVIVVMMRGVASDNDDDGESVDDKEGHV